MEQKLLTDPLVKPEDIVLEDVLGKSYPLFTEFVNKINELNLVLEWTYYNDAKSWLGKVLNKKKNLCWVSVWNTGFKLTFYFPESAIDEVYQLDIDNEIKNNAREIKPVGKSHPVIILVKNKKYIKNGLKILEYKKSLK
jgi:hypothetical protein